MSYILNNFPLFIVEVIDLFYKISIIIALFYATKALRIYIDRAGRNGERKP